MTYETEEQLGLRIIHKRTLTGLEAESRPITTIWRRGLKKLKIRRVNIKCLNMSASSRRVDFFLRTYECGCENCKEFSSGEKNVKAEIDRISPGKRELIRVLL